MKCFVINLERATERRTHCENLFAQSQLELVLVPAVDGKTLNEPFPNYSDRGYRLCHGKRTNPNQVACYLSHLKAMSMLVETGDDYGIIMEDDVQFGPDLSDIVEKAILARPEVGCLRLAGRRNSKPVITDRLDDKHQLGIDLTRQTGSGCYLLSRETAKAMLEKMPPMIVPIDHSFDRDWRWSGLTMRVIPFPAGQKANPGTSFNADQESDRLPSFQRYLTVFPFRAYNESRRFFYRLRTLLTLSKSKSRTDLGT